MQMTGLKKKTKMATALMLKKHTHNMTVARAENVKG